MSKLDDLKAAFKSCVGRPYPWKDFVQMLGLMGFKEIPKGKTGGSRRRWKHPSTNRPLMLHQPHKKEMKPYAVRDARAYLEEQGLL